ncbi:hypothetical protein Tco_1014893 [Tanacetum coccineum]
MGSVPGQDEASREYDIAHLNSYLSLVFIVSEIRLDTPYGDKWIWRIGCAYGVLESSRYAGSGIDHYAFLVLRWR